MVHFVFWKRLPPHHLKIKGESSSMSCRAMASLSSWTATERTTARHLLGHASLATVGCEAPMTMYPRGSRWPLHASAGSDTASSEGGKGAR